MGLLGRLKDPVPSSRRSFQASVGLELVSSPSIAIGSGTISSICAIFAELEYSCHIPAAIAVVWSGPDGHYTGIEAFHKAFHD